MRSGTAVPHPPKSWWLLNPCAGNLIPFSVKPVFGLQKASRTPMLTATSSTVDPPTLMVVFTVYRYGASVFHKLTGPGRAICE